MKRIVEISGSSQMTKIYDFDYYRLQKEKRLRNALGISYEDWNIMKAHGYDPTLEEDRDKFYEDLKDG